MGSRLVKTGSFVVKITDVCVGPRDDVDIVLLVIIKPEAQNENQLAHTKENFMCCEEKSLNEKPRKIMYIASDKTETWYYLLNY